MAEKEDIVRSYAIGLVLDDATDQRAIALSREYRPKARERDFVLGSGGIMPYMAHLHIMLDDEALKRVAAEIDRIACATDAPTGEFSEIAAVNDGWLFWRTPRTAKLAAHHREVVDACAPHRKGTVHVAWTMTSEQVRVRDLIGYPAALECFDPHVTLQVLAQRHAHQPVRIERFPWTALSLALFHTGRHGSAQGIVHYRDFKDVPPPAPSAA